MNGGMVLFHCPLEQRTCTSVYVDKYSAPSRSHLNDLAADAGKSSNKIYSANTTIHASMQITTMATAKKIKSRFE
jgi:hypothetical protein